MGVTNSRRRPLAYLMIAMALGEVCLAVAFSWSASVSMPAWADYRTKVELPLWFAAVPAIMAVGVSIHVWLARHVDRRCPWVNLGWLLLAVNIVALMLFIQMTR